MNPRACIAAGLCVLSASWLALVVFYDLASQRLPNFLTLGGFALFAAWKTACAGAGGFFSAALGAAAGAGVMLPFFLARAAGGGDVKLMLGVGALAGWPLALSAFFWISVVVCGFAVSAAMRRLLLSLFVRLFRRPARFGEADRPLWSRLRIRFGTPAAVGTLIALCRLP